jgi:hypothetical protein
VRGATCGVRRAACGVRRAGCSGEVRSFCNVAVRVRCRKCIEFPRVGVLAEQSGAVRSVLLSGMWEPGTIEISMRGNLRIRCGIASSS